jgi:6-pyruvoyltetrahydropterin/6-carboxytetrahydropterin synthase
MEKPLSDTSNVKLGMVVDFCDLKKIVQTTILDTYDHALVLNEEAPYSKSEVISNEFEKVILVPFQPTCENLLLYFVELLKPTFDINMQLVSVRLDETPSSYAEWQVTDNH